MNSGLGLRAAEGYHIPEHSLRAGFSFLLRQAGAHPGFWVPATIFGYVVAPVQHLSRGEANSGKF
jgi:hypothetical protein